MTGPVSLTGTAGDIVQVAYNERPGTGSHADNSGSLNVTATLSN